MFQLSFIQFTTILVITIMWTITSLCACRIIDELIENVKKIKQELAELQKLKEPERPARLDYHPKYILSTN